MRPKWRARIWVSRVKMDRIQLVVTHYGAGYSSIYHAAHDADHFTVVGATIYKVTQKDALPRRIAVAPRICFLAIAKARQRIFQFFGLTVNVWNDIVQF